MDLVSTDRWWVLQLLLEAGGASVCSYGFDASSGSDYGGEWAWFQPVIGGYSRFDWRLEELQCVSTGLML